MYYTSNQGTSVPEQHHAPTGGRRRSRFRLRAGAVSLAAALAVSALGAGAASAHNTGSTVGASGSGVLEQIAACESGGDPSAVSPDGLYRGKYQFSVETWQSLGGTGDPAAAPEAVQDQLAAQLLAQAGTSPWPNCA